MGDLSFDDPGPITDAEVARLMAEYEETHAVEDYWALGWQLWPFLRAMLATDIYNTRNYALTALAHLGATPRDEKRGIGGLTRAFIYHSKLLRDYVKWAWAVKRGAALGPSHPCDVLIFGSGERYQFVGGKWVHYATGPLADLLEHAGLRCHMWQWREQPSPATRPSANVVPSLRAGLGLVNVLRHFRSSPLAPSWFPEFASFYHAQLHRDLSWESLAGKLAEMLPMSNILERWLQRARPGLVVLDNWYNGPMVSAALAAHRLGIPVMDLQHGIQEQTHFAYHWWHKEPIGGWEARPDIFWVWGERTENLFHETNHIQQEILRGGNPWILRWLSETDPDIEATCGEARRLVERHSRSILVTLPSPPSLCLPFLKDIISTSPSNWVWLIRTHPRETIDPQPIERELGNSSRAEVRLQQATEWPLYALLRAVDLHVSNNSTCSNEALAFGKPTILISKPGLAHFREFVETGVMFYTERHEDFFETAERALEVDPACLKRAARSVFVVDESETSRAVNRIVEVVRSVRQKKTYAAT